MSEQTVLDAAPSVNSKRCTVCKLVKPFSEFKKSKRPGDGRTGQCRACKRRADANPGRAKRNRLMFLLVQVPLTIKLKTAVVPLGDGTYALIDVDDWRQVGRHFWSPFRPPKSQTTYANGWINGKHILLHQYLKPVSSGMMVDHADRNGLNNRKENLREATRAQNVYNRELRKIAASGYRGVHRCKKRWVAYIGVNSKRKRLGSFGTAIEAALAYDKAARERSGEFAVLNFANAEVPLG